MRNIRSLVLAWASLLLVRGTLFAQFTTSVVSYTPGSGVSAAYTHPESALGEPSRFTPGLYGGPVDPFDSPYLGSQLVSVGAGGSLTLAFAKPITSDPYHPFGLDFLIFGNAFFIGTNTTGELTDGTIFGTAPGSSRVSVSPDGVTYYLLNPQLAPVVDNYYPTDGAGNFFLPVNPTLAPQDFAGLGVPGIRQKYAGSGGGAGFSLAWAEDAAGHSVALSSASYVRIDVLSGKSEIDGIAAVAPSALSLRQDFATNPPTNGWSFFGDPSLFVWNQTNQNLEVTWDSSRANSYFQLPLGTIMTRHDDFRVELDLELHDITGGIDPTKPGPLQLAFGFQNRADAEKSSFNRGTSEDSPNLVEFDFFPDTGFGPTVWPTVISTNSSVNYNGTTDFSLFDLPTGVPLHIALAYTSSNQTVLTSITTNGVLVGPITSARLSTNSSSLSQPFTQFAVDTFALASYSDQGLPPGPFASSLLAHGTIDNIVVTFPPPPIQSETGVWAEGLWQQSFLSRTNWNYSLQATTDFRTWSDLGTVLTGTGGQLVLVDTNAPAFPARFYRVAANRAD